MVTQVIGHNWRRYDWLNNGWWGGELTLGLVLGNMVNYGLGLTRNGPR